MTLTAPDHLKGPMKPWSEVSSERDAWAAKMALCGYSTAQIGKALGIRQENAHRAARRGGWRHKAKPAGVSSVLERLGVQIGFIGPVFHAMDVKHQNSLIDAAMKQNATIAEVLVKTFVEGRQ